MTTTRLFRSVWTAVLAAGLLALGPGTAAAQQTGTVAGTVTDTDGRPLDGAQVAVVGTDRGTVTTWEGEFTIADVPTGTHTLRVTLLGYRETTISDVIVRAGAAARADVTLATAPIELAGVVVSASREAERVTDAPATVTRVDADAIANTVGNAFTGALKQIKGLDYIQTGVTGAAINARGFNSSFNNRMLMMIDGRIGVLPENGLPVGSFTAVPKIDLAGIEVLVGPGAALYGADASNGVITLETKDPREYPGTTVEATGGTREYRNVQFRHGGASGSVGYKVAGEYQAAHDWENSLEYGGVPEADVDWNSSVMRAEGALVYYSGSSRLEVAGGWSQTDGVGQTNVGRNQLQDWTYNFAQAKLTTPHWYLNVYRTQSQSGESYAIDRFSQTKAALPDLSEDSIRKLSDWPSDGQLYAAELQNNFTLDALLGTRVTWGAQYRHDRVSSKGQWLTDSKTGEPLGIDQYGVYAQTETPLSDRVELILAGRYDHHQDYEAQFSPKAGLLFKPAPDQTLRITYNRAFKSPTTLATHFWIPNFVPISAALGLGVYGNRFGFTLRDAGGSVVGEVDPLVPEENQTVELGYKGVLMEDRLYLDMTGYYAAYENFFGSLGPLWPADQLGQVWAYDQNDDLVAAPNGAAQWVYTYQNLGEATIRGLDTGVRFRPAEDVVLSSTLSWIDLTDVENPTGDTDATALNSTPVKWTLGAEFEEIAPNLFGDATVRHVTGYHFASGINNGDIPTFNTLDLGLGYRIPEMGAQINVNVSNLFTCRSESADPAMDSGCGFDHKHIEMVNMPAVGATLFVGVRYHHP